MVSTTKTLHTPGPWEVANCGYEVGTQLGGINTFGEEALEDEAWTVATCAFGELSNAECKANARLIAAAPALLAACEAVISAGESENLPTTVYDAVEAAIAKANGESA